MVFKLSRVVRVFRRVFSRSEWAIRLLGLSRANASPTTPGLVMVQIDGLSRPQLTRALSAHDMPFLKRLVDHENYTLHSHYSGMPSNTPSVQGEIFYGVKSCVPAFSYLDRKSGRIFKMYDTASASEVERRLEKVAPGLLAEGSSYSNVFTGGAKDARFCAAKIGWKALFCAPNPLVLPILMVLYFDILLRTAILMVIEFVLATIDCVRGTFAGKRFWKELEFVPTRVAVCVLLRELVIAGATIDVARGLPVIHLNLLGYDEQSHRRGPTSKFAHWSLRGIDDAIGRVWRSAHRSAQRHYDVWVYSDHGQENAHSYTQKNGRSLEAAVAEFFGKRVHSDDPGPLSHWESGAGLLESHALDSRPGEEPADESLTPSRVIVTAMGPIAHVYVPGEMDACDKERFASEMPARLGVPAVMLPSRPEEALVWTEDGRFSLPADAARLLGPDHPFLEEAARDVAALAHHPDAGDFIILGWRHGAQSSSFPLEHGSHAGAGPQETHGFALLTSDAPLPPLEKPYLRPAHIREAALRVLGRSDGRVKRAFRPASLRTVRIMTYNVHGCVGLDGKCSPERIARVIARHDADVVTLQELDVGRSRSGCVDQVEQIARRLDMTFHFHPTFLIEDGQYGNAILSRFPMYLVKVAPLPQLRKDLEPRGAMWVAIDIGFTKLQLINSHLSIWPAERLLQAEALSGADWLANSACSGPVVLCGDFNALPTSPAYRKIGSVLRDTQLHLNAHRPQNTWMGLGRIDHVFVGPRIQVTGIRVPTTSLDRQSSDHWPLVVDIHVPEEDAPSLDGLPLSSRAWVMRTDPKTGRREIEKESRERTRD